MQVYVENFRQLMRRREFVVAIAITGLIAVIASSVLANRWSDHVIESDRREALSHANEDVDHIARTLHREIVKFEIVARAIAAVLERQPNLTQEHYDNLVGPLISNTPAIRHVATSTGYIVDRIHPLNGNQDALGLDYSDLPSQLADVERALHTNEGVVSGPVDLVQGGSAFIYRLPYRVFGEFTGEEIKVGIVSIVVDRNHLVDQVLSAGHQHLVEVALRALEENGDVNRHLSGDFDVFEKDPVTRWVPVGEAYWEVGLLPNFDGLNERISNSTIWPLSFLICSATLAIFFSFWMLHRSKRIVEGQLKSAINSIEDGFALYDSDDRLVYVNEKYRSYYGLSRDVIVPGNRFEDVLREGLRRGQYADAIGREEEWLQERLLAHRNPTEPLEQKLADGRWLKIAESRSPDGCTVGFRVDVTELKRAREQAEAANQAKTNFLNVISHELRTPLTSVIGYARLIENLQVLPGYKELQEAIETDASKAVRKAALKQMSYDISNMSNRITTSSDHLLGLINDVLERAKFDANTIDLNPSEFDLSHLVGSVTKGLAVNAQEKGLTLSHEVASFSVVADEFRIRQALINIVANAIKFTDQGGVHISAIEDKSCVRLMVRDTGCGIAAEDQEAIFDQFVQVDASVTRRNSGIGLGLAITQEILSLHGGDVTVTSAVDEGSTFTLTIPRKKAQQTLAA